MWDKSALGNLLMAPNHFLESSLTFVTKQPPIRLKKLTSCFFIQIFMGNI